MYALPLLDHDARRTLAGNTIIRIVASCRRAATLTMIKKYFAKSGQLILTGITHQDLVECETGSVHSNTLRQAQSSSDRLSRPRRLARYK